jgi:hypothetical protein
MVCFKSDMGMYFLMHNIYIYMEQQRHPCFEICDNTAVSANQICEKCPNNGKGAHGIAWERPVCKMIIKEIKEAQSDIKDYPLFFEWVKNTDRETTAIHDITPELMGLTHWPEAIVKKYGHGVSVKLMKIGCEICCADMKRIYNNFTDNWSQIIGLYEIKNVEGIKCYCIKKVFFLRFRNGVTDRRLMFGAAEEGDFSDLAQALKTAKKNHPGEPRGSGGIGKAREKDRLDVQDKTRALGERLKDGGFRGFPTQKSKRPILRIRPKIDRSQARLQCAYNYPLFLQLIQLYAKNGQAMELYNAGAAAILYNPVLAKGDAFYIDSGGGGGGGGGGSSAKKKTTTKKSKSKQKKGGARGRRRRCRKKTRKRSRKKRKRKRTTRKRRIK